MIEPLNSRVYVETIAKSRMSSGGLHLPDAEQVNTPSVGRVLAVGPNASGVVAVGDLVLFGRYAGIEVSLDGDGRLLLQEEELLARVGEEDGWSVTVHYEGGELDLGRLINATVLPDKLIIAGSLTPFDRSSEGWRRVLSSGVVDVEARRQTSDGGGQSVIVKSIPSATLVTSDNRLMALPY